MQKYNICAYTCMYIEKKNAIGRMLLFFFLLLQFVFVIM